MYRIESAQQNFFNKYEKIVKHVIESKKPQHTFVDESPVYSNGRKGFSVTNIIDGNTDLSNFDPEKQARALTQNLENRKIINSADDLLRPINAHTQLLQGELKPVVPVIGKKINVEGSKAMMSDATLQDFITPHRQASLVYGNGEIAMKLKDFDGQQHDIQSALDHNFNTENTKVKYKDFNTVRVPFYVYTDRKQYTMIEKAKLEVNPFWDNSIDEITRMSDMLFQRKIAQDLLSAQESPYTRGFTLMYQNNNGTNLATNDAVYSAIFPSSNAFGFSSATPAQLQTITQKLRQTLNTEYGDLPDGSFAKPNTLIISTKEALQLQATDFVLVGDQLTNAGATYGTSITALSYLAMRLNEIGVRIVTSNLVLPNNEVAQNEVSRYKTNIFGNGSQYILYNDNSGDIQEVLYAGHKTILNTNFYPVDGSGFAYEMSRIELCSGIGFARQGVAYKTFTSL